MIDLTKFIGLPYKHMGRDFNGVDCFGLCWLIYSDYLKIEIPHFLEIQYTKNWYDTGKNHILENVYWVEKVNFPYQKFDGLLFIINNNIVNHIGLYIGNNKFIHIFDGITSRIERLNRYWSNRLYSGMRFIKNG